MLRCAILDDYQNVALAMADWNRLSSEVEVAVFNQHIADPRDRAARLADFDIVVAMRERTAFDADLLARLPKLKLLVTTGMHNASIDVGAAERQGIVVCGTRGSLGATAQLTWALILALVRNIPDEVTDFRHGAAWQSHLSTDLTGKRLGVVGFGKLGARVARVGRDFEMDVVAWSPTLTDARAAEAGAKRSATLDELLSSSDVVTVHVVLNGGTRGLIGEREFGMMKPTAFLVNTSRGPIVDEAALLAALNAGRLAGAGVDVFDREPLPLNHPFRRSERLIATPHIGYVTDVTYRIFYRDVVEDIVAWLQKEPVRRLSA